MPKIKQVLGMDNKGSYAIVQVLTDEGDECAVFIGGAIQVYFHHGKIKAFIKRTIDTT